MNAIEDRNSTGWICYTTINHTARNYFDLNLTEYCVADSIRVLGSIEPENKGWCYSSKKYLSDFLKISESSVFRALNNLEEKELIERNTLSKENNTKIGYLRTTKKFNEAVSIKALTPSPKGADPICQNDSIPMSNCDTPYVKVTDNKDVYKDIYNDNVDVVVINSKKYGKFEYLNRSNYPMDKINRAIQCLDTTTTTIRNPSGYIDSAIAGNWYPADGVEQSQHAQAEQKIDETKQYLKEMKECEAQVAEQKKKYLLSDDREFMRLKEKLGIAL